MAGSEYEIELFGKKLIYSEGKLRDIKLHFFMDDLYELIKMQVGQLFDNAGDLNGLLYTTNEDITEIYVTMYDVTIQYIEKNVLKGIEAKDNILDLADTSDNWTCSLSRRSKFRSFCAGNKKLF